MKQNLRIGFGYDVHAFTDNRKLILGGVEIPNERGLKGHSDADVLIHAICDALLGALALGDIGSYFPDTDSKWKNTESKIFLEKANELIINEGYIIANIDSTLVIEKPKIAPHIMKIRSKLSEILKINIDQVSIKATTSEKLGFIGRQEGVAAFTNALLILKENEC
ncbi:2-C-methyl-D-erythritol 2,4-cyclodiphosphate synthase [Bacteroidota bacterium]